jgi:hypothetical protein
VGNSIHRIQVSALPRVISSMTGFSGYSTSKFVPLLKSVPTWSRVAEDNSSVYVQLQQADNFYQFPVVVKETRPVADNNGVAALVDAYSDTAHQNLVYQNLTVIVAANSRISSQLHANSSTYLLGFFSVNL